VSRLRSPIRAEELLGFLNAWLEVTTKLQAAGRTAEHRHFSGHLVRDGYWVDVHLSMVPYTQSDRQVFLDFLDAIRIEPKAR
jgi:hypothetical protein